MEFGRGDGRERGGAPILVSDTCKFDAFTLSLEQYDDLDKVSLDGVISSLTIYELPLKERESHEEEQVLLA